MTATASYPHRSPGRSPTPAQTSARSRRERVVDGRRRDDGDRIQLAAETAATSTAKWHAHRTRTTRREAHRIMRLATGLDHHDPIPWLLGGGTNRDAIMLCPGHHTRAHDPTYTMTKLLTGRVAFHRRTWADRLRRQRLPLTVGAWPAQSMSWSSVAASRDA